ncbi:MAG: CHASE2 domain-containing protein [Armatimonadetes bacterium]|nr:CHASE2 domain-containing protein [Armatimonadota bacterium]
MGRYWRRVLGLSLALAVGLSTRGPLAELELRVLDFMLVARHAQGGVPAPDPRILLVEIDEATLREVGKPWALWQPDLTQVMRALRGQALPRSDLT